MLTITSAVNGTGALQDITIEAFDSDGIKNGLNGSRIFDIDMNAANSTTTLIGLRLTRSGVFPLISTFALAA